MPSSKLPSLPLLRRSLSRGGTLGRWSERRTAEVAGYDFARRRFLAEHPYCQLWLREHGIAEEVAIQNQGNVRLSEPDGPLIPVPLATEIHHRNKRRAERLLETRDWMAVSSEAHHRIEAHKDWARAAGYLRDF